MNGSDQYDPNLRDDIPYMANGNVSSMYGKHTLNEGSFINLNDIGKYQRTAQQNSPSAAQLYQQQMASIKMQQRPNFDFAGSNIQSMNDALQKMGNIAEVTIGGTNQQPENTAMNPNPNPNTNTNSIDINLVINSIDNTLNMLNNVDLWIPVSKKEYTKKLSSVAQPIIKALSAYSSTLKKMS